MLLATTELARPWWWYWPPIHASVLGALRHILGLLAFRFVWAVVMQCSYDLDCVFLQLLNTFTLVMALCLDLQPKSRPVTILSTLT